METNDPMSELLFSLEQIVLTRDGMPAVIALKDNMAMPESQRIREITGLQIDEFAQVLGVSVSSVKSWEAKRSKPSRSTQKLMQLIKSNPYLSRDLLN
ncbi:HTH-type transcriptional regulator [Erwinia piriflorinigrans]|uniref:Putative HTH-type transcriptional regulator yiaG n=1 Tax=Erwinia piriflorinigrans CFBP 5888 TaxID=1161919 RepID=V5ZCJ2_9GAMM|nr:HTH-type transcriptional regulator [Erwinia piriflorinigrans]CCG89088.1 putative HTH-type transcriptional regulator yiaG [Erwinia piriflorinigrans CFBP 5888]